jgi:hypothetical protein
MLTNQLGAGAADLAELVPELGQFGPDLPRSLSADAESMRFRLFDAVTTLVSEEARSKPIVLVLEDITLGLALLVALFGPAGVDAIQILNMLTVTAGVLLMLLVITPDGYHKAGWLELGLHRAGWRYWPLALLAPTAVLVASYAAATLVGVVSWQFESDAAINPAGNG